MKVIWEFIGPSTGSEAPTAAEQSWCALSVHDNPNTKGPLRYLFPGIILGLQTRYFLLPQASFIPRVPLKVIYNVPYPPQGSFSTSATPSSHTLHSSLFQVFSFSSFFLLPIQARVPSVLVWREGGGEGGEGGEGWNVVGDGGSAGYL